MCVFGLGGKQGPRLSSGKWAPGRRVQAPLCVAGPVLLWLLALLAGVVSAGSFLLCHRRACWKWMQQSE